MSPAEARQSCSVLSQVRSYDHRWVAYRGVESDAEVENESNERRARLNQDCLRPFIIPMIYASGRDGAERDGVHSCVFWLDGTLPTAAFLSEDPFPLRLGKGRTNA
jgi:hypothetical protein